MMLEEFMSEFATKERQEYRPEKAGDGISKHVWRNAWQLLAVSLLCWISVWLNLEYAYPGRSDIERWLLEAHVHIVIGMTAITWSLLFLQWITNSNLLGRAMQHAISAAIVIAAWLLVMGLMVIGV